MAVADRIGSTLTALSFETSIDASGYALVTASAAATDDGTGVDRIVIELDRARLISDIPYDTLTIDNADGYFIEGPQSSTYDDDLDRGRGRLSAIRL